MRLNDLDLYNKYLNIKIRNIINKSLKENNFIFGDSVKKLEKKLSELSGSKYTITVGSGTDALLLSLMCLDLKSGDEIIIPSFSWLSVLEVVLFLKLKPVFLETNLNDFNIDISSVEKKINKKTKALISTSLFGRSVDLIQLKEICKRNKITLIEDAAQNFGSKIGKLNSCNIADFSCTSFFPSKNLGAYGDGGAIFTNNKKFYKILIKIRNHGQIKYNKSSLVGLNSRIGSIQASILLQKLKDFKEKKKIHKKVYFDYSNFFKKNKIVGFPLDRNGTKFDDMNSQFSILIRKRSLFIRYLDKYKIDYKIYYSKPLYKQFNLKNNLYLKNTEFICKRIITLPFNEFSRKRFNYVLKNLSKVISTNKGIFFEKKN